MRLALHPAELTVKFYFSSLLLREFDAGAQTERFRCTIALIHTRQLNFINLQILGSVGLTIVTTGEPGSFLTASIIAGPLGPPISSTNSTELRSYL